MPVDPEMPARVARLTGVDPDRLPPPAERIASTARALAAVGLDSPAVHTAPYAIWTLDHSGTVRSWNARAEEVLGWSADETIGAEFPGCTSADARRELVDRLVAAGSDRAAVELEAVTRTGDVRHLRIVVSAAGAADLGGDVVCFAADVTDHHQASATLQAQHDRWRRLLTGIADTVAIVDADGVVREVETDKAEVLGLDPSSFLGQDGFALLEPEDRERARPRWYEMLEDAGHEYRDVLRFRDVRGHTEDIECSAINLLDDPIIEGIVMAMHIVTDQRRHEDLVAREAAILEAIATGASLEDTLIAVTGMVEAHSGGSAAVFLVRADGRGLDVGAAGSVDRQLLDTVRRIPLSPSPSADVFGLRRPAFISDFATSSYTEDHADRLAEMGAVAAWSIPVIENRTDELLGLITVFLPETVTPTAHQREVGEVAAHLAGIAIERTRWQERLEHQTRHHHLTGLPNRATIIEHLDHALERAAERHETDVAVIFVDIDRFKVVNDNYGHAAGDKLLQRFAKRLRTLVRPSDLVGHFGADEFVIVLEEATGVDEPHAVTNRLELALSEPFALDEGEVYLSASIGVAVSTGEETSTDLVQHADAAMARAKELGRNRTEVFDQPLRSWAGEQLRLARELRSACDNGEMVLHYQPVVSLRSGRAIGVETLLRWNHPTEGLLEPQAFLDVAEESGTIVRIGRWVLDTALADVRRWSTEHESLANLHLGLNMSPREVRSPGLARHVAQALERHSFPGHHLTLELTEAALIDDPDALLATLEDLRALGTKVAIDDFGTGFSSLNFLHRFPLTLVKVDPMFLGSIDADGSGSPVLNAVMHMAHALGITVGAEGVEEPKQLEGLRALDCDFAQGRLLAPPLPAGEIVDVLLASRARTGTAVVEPTGAPAEGRTTIEARP